MEEEGICDDQDKIAELPTGTAKDSDYLSMALGFATPAKDLVGLASTAKEDDSIQKMAFGNSNRKRKKLKRQKRASRKGSSIAPDEDPHGGSPSHKNTSQTKAKGAKSALSFRSICKCGVRMISALCNPFRRCWLFLSRKALCCQYVKALHTITTDYLWTELFRQPLHLVAMFGLCCSIAAEVMDLSPRYNSYIICVLLGSSKFAMFPSGTMRPQICLVLLTILSIAVDVYYMISAPQSSAYYGGMKALVALTSISKVAGSLNFLQHGQGTGKARKYLDRRLRLFGIPLQLPRRMMRDIRGRIIAIELLEFVAVVVFTVLFVLSITSFNYTVFAVSSGSISISTALFSKAVSSLVVALCFLYDTDIVLALGYFGFLGFAMKFYVRYVNQKRRELGGWPYAYSFNSLRFNACAVAKAIDVCIGVMVWISLRAAGWRGMASDMRAFYGFVLCAMLVIDVWASVLLLCTYYLLGKQQELLDDGEGSSEDGSDDSELDELAIRNGTETKPKSQKQKIPQELIMDMSELKRQSAKRSKRLSAKGRREDKYLARKNRNGRHRDRGSESDSDSNADDSESDEEAASSSSSSGGEDDMGMYNWEAVEDGIGKDTPLAARFNITPISTAPVSRPNRRNSHSGSDGDRDSAGKVTPTKLLYSYNKMYSRGNVDLPPISLDNKLDDSAVQDLDEEASMSSVNTTSTSIGGPVFELDRSAEVEPITFTHLWETLLTSASFDCVIAVDDSIAHNPKEPTAMHMFDLRQFSNHLKKMGFFVVAAGTHADGFVKVYVFGCYSLRMNPQLRLFLMGNENTSSGNSNRIVFVAELRIQPIASNMEAYVVNDFDSKHRRFQMSCTAKCSHSQFTGTFIGEFNFGDIYELI